MRPEKTGSVNHRTGFTLIEVLVVLAIIGLLVALLLPAVQAARESSRRTHCINNLRQLGLALGHYGSAHDGLPSGQGLCGQSLFVALLPQMEQSQLFNALNFAAVPLTLGWSNTTVTETTLATLLCPSDPEVLRWVGSISYAGNTGDGLYSSKFNGLFSGISDNPWNVKFSGISDGLSNTVAISEWLIGKIDSAEPRRNFYSIAAGSPPDRGRFEGLCRDVPRTNPRPASTNLKGDGWVRGEWSRTIYDHAMPINNPNCILSENDDFIGACGSSSFHPGGANVLFADGHAAFIKNAVNHRVWSALGTRSGNETISSDSF